MAYLLQPNLHIVEQPALPPACATDSVFTYPVPSSQNYCCRPNTMVYGTAPYMAGKGAPNELMMVDDELRPQSTMQFNRKYVRTYEDNMYPLQDMRCSTPLRTKTYDPVSTRANVYNALFTQRYCN